MKYLLRSIRIYCLRPYWLAHRWFRLQHQIYSTPRKDRPVFWEVQRQMTIAKAHMKYELGIQIYGGFHSQRHPKEIDGLGFSRREGKLSDPS